MPTDKVLSSPAPPSPQVRVHIVRGKTTQLPVRKADTVTNMPRENAYAAGDWLPQPLDFDGLDALVDHSTILPQCIQAYRNNIPGFGISVDYRDEYKNQDETPEMVAEYDRLTRIMDLLCYDCSTQEMFARVVACRERFGIAYVEVIRNLAGEVVEIVNIQYPASIEQTLRIGDYVEVPFFHEGELLTRRRRFRKFKQEVAGRTVYFKEFGDPRIMDLRTGEYVDELELKYQANEILDFPIGDKPYGQVRWVGQIAGVDGAYKAESLNRNYFDNGRHTPMMIMVNGGTLTDESFAKLQEYMEEIKGEAGQHSFLVLETENINTAVGFEEERVPSIEIKDLSPMLQKDELFQNYLDNVRRKCQSAFQLPDLYVGYTTDFNRATAQTAMEITEKQVFIPQRQELAWIINHKLLADYHFQYVEVSFRSPDVTNPDDQAKILTIAERAGGVTPNEAHRLAASLTGDSAEDFSGEWGNIPLTYAKIAGDREAAAAQSAAEALSALRAPEAEAEGTGTEETGTEETTAAEPSPEPAAEDAQDSQGEAGLRKLAGAQPHRPAPSGQCTSPVRGGTLPATQPFLLQRNTAPQPSTRNAASAAQKPPLAGEDVRASGQVGLSPDTLSVTPASPHRGDAPLQSSGAVGLSPNQKPPLAGEVPSDSEAVGLSSSRFAETSAELPDPSSELIAVMKQVRRVLTDLRDGEAP